MDFGLEVFPDLNERFYVREGFVQLVCKEKIYGEGGGSGTSEEVYASDAFPVDMEFLAGLPYRRSLTLNVPPDVPPTVYGKIARIDCRLKMRLVVEGVQDIFHDQEVTILSPRPSQLLIEGSPAFGSSSEDASFEQCELSLSLASNQINLGDTLAGKLRLVARQNLRPKDIWIQLDRRERVTGNSDDQVVVKEVFYKAPSFFKKAARLENDEVQEWSFELQLPECEVPSVATQKTEINWVVRGAMRRLGRIAFIGQGMFDVEKGVQVATK